MMKYLVALDGSAHADKALKMAKRFATDNDTVLLLSVGTFSESKLSKLFDEAGVIEAKTKVLTATEQLVSEKMKEAEELGIKNVVGKAEVGSARTIICDIAKAEDVDMILMGARGLGVLERMVMGSVSDFVMQHAHCDVLIAKTEVPTDVELVE